MKIMYIAIAFFLVGLLGYAPYKAYGTIDTVTNVVVTGKEIKRNGQTSDRYLIATRTQNGSVEVFENTDAWLNGKFASSDMNAIIAEGDMCTFTVNDWRVPLFSMYRNILETDCSR